MIISKMIVSRLSRKPDKNWAVFTALFLIFLSFVIASLLPSLKGTQNLELIFTSLFVLISWDMVNAMVGGAIDQAVKSANQQNIDNLKANTQEEYLKKQDAEFQAWVSSKYVRSSYSLLQNDRDLEISKKNALIRDEIVNVLTKNKNDLIIKIATNAAIFTLNKENLSDEDNTRDPKLAIFRNDVIIYLRAWLIISIKYDREMQSELIQQSYPTQKSPNKQDYLKALKYIKDNLIERDTVADNFQKEYKNEAKTIIKSYLSKLIERIKKEP